MKEVNIHLLNAGKGESIVVEFVSEPNKYVVIDSNLIKINSKFINPAYEFLKSKKVNKISSLIVTHLHKDHYNGIELLLHNFEIEKIIIPPFLSTNSDQYNKIIDSFKKEINRFAESCTDNELYQYVTSLTHLIKYLTQNETKIEEATGKESILRFPGIEGIDAVVYLPLKKIKGRLQHLINNTEYILKQFPEMNDSSIAIMLSCFGFKVLLTGDSTSNQWQEHQIQMERDNVFNLGSDCLKAPHHGSKHNNTEKLYKYFFSSNDKKKYIIVSANGTTHPDKEFFNLIQKFSLIPYCTNFSPNCLPRNVIQFIPMPNIPKEMHTFLRNYVERIPIPCQGNITLNISTSGVIISNSTNISCVYRHNL